MLLREDGVKTSASAKQKNPAVVIELVFIGDFLKVRFGVFETRVNSRTHLVADLLRAILFSGRIPG